MEQEFAYDSLPYSNEIFAQTNPDRICSISKLFGLDAPDVTNCRVLELGCGNGLNLIHQAYSFPNSEFVGIDLAENHIEYAQASVDELKLSNIKFQQCDLTEMSVKDFGKFDYIIAHGLITWIPEQVRQKTFSLYEEMLTEKGVGYISYNTYPGWHSKQMLRGIGRIHTRAIDSPVEKIKASMEFFNYLGNNSQDELHKNIINNELMELVNVKPTGMYHDILAENNKPYYFYEFAEIIDKYELQFVSESELFSMATFTFPPNIREFLDKIEDIIWQGQYRDFITGRSFRQSLICRKYIELNHEIDAKVLDDFHIASSVEHSAEKSALFDDSVIQFSGLEAKGIEINHPLTKVALHKLSKTQGNTILFSELLTDAKNTFLEIVENVEDIEQDLEIAQAIFLQLIRSTKLIDLHSYTFEINREISEKPKVNSFVQWQINKFNSMTNSSGKSIKLEDPVMKHLVQFLDGTNTKDDLTDKLKDFINESDNLIRKDELIEDLPQNLEENLQMLAKIGILDS